MKTPKAVRIRRRFMRKAAKHWRRSGLPGARRFWLETAIAWRDYSLRELRKAAKIS